MLSCCVPCVVCFLAGYLEGYLPLVHSVHYLLLPHAAAAHISGTVRVGQSSAVLCCVLQCIAVQCSAACS
jgi:hypothetical protein